jgi:uncharacterized protein YjbI with pentapeptide repeats
VSEPQRPTDDNREAWRVYWQAADMPWRTEPEIEAERQAYLAERRAVTPNFRNGVYPFRDLRLTRADVEWLLATHESRGIRGPVDWNDERQHGREGLDLRGANLREVSLRGLPLARLRGGPNWEEWQKGTRKQRERAAAQLTGTSFREADLQSATLCRAHLNVAMFKDARLHGADFRRAYLERAFFRETNLQGVDLSWTRLTEGRLTDANLRGARLLGTHLEGAELAKATLAGAHLEGAFLTGATDLKAVTLQDKQFGCAYLADVHWGEVNLAVVDWTVFTDRKVVLGDEQTARDWKPEPFTETEEERKKPRQERAQARADHVAQQSQARLAAAQAPVRANRQLATALRNQGMNEEADYFAYRAQRLQRRVFQLQGKRVRASFSRFLDLLAGYGYAPQRSLIWYIVTVLSFAVLYLIVAQLPLQEALILSVTSFHGRGFPGSLTLHDPIMIVAAAEAIFGLLIEISFIATFTQRFFAR